MEIVYSISSMIYLGNVGIQAILFESSSQNAYVLWITGLPSVVSVQLLSVTLAFLTIERCFGMRFLVTSIHRWHNLLTYCYFVTLIIATLSLSVGHLFKAMPEEPWLSCNTYKCVATGLGKTVYLAEIVIFGTLNVVMSVVLKLCMRYQIVKSRLTIKLNGLVLSSVLILILLDFAPKTGLVVAYQMFNYTLVSYAPLTSIISAISNLIIAFVHKSCFNVTEIQPNERSTSFARNSTKTAQVGHF
uniref:G_PROTEIN_RECEP_F1_2 domain-containing protein n=1 Tax=Panagrellus redivivus TaxID=6233 RepID=A0A7E4ZZR9_PANRE